MNIHIELNNSVNYSLTPDISDFKHWTENTLLTVKYLNNTPHLSIALVSEQQIQQINTLYRHKNKPTNILSFPPPDHTSTNTLGELLMCPAVIELEAKQSQLVQAAHWAHLTTHGVLHLLGYDHVTDEQAQIMETIEVDCMFKLGYKNPYKTRDQ